VKNLLKGGVTLESAFRSKPSQGRRPVERRKVLKVGENYFTADCECGVLRSASWTSIQTGTRR